MYQNALFKKNNSLAQCEAVWLWTLVFFFLGFKLLIIMSIGSSANQNYA